MNSESSSYRSYSHNGSKIAYYTPHGYDIIRITSLRSAVVLWINGDKTFRCLIDGKVIEQPVRPSLLWDVDNIPKLWKKFVVGSATLKKCMSSSELLGWTSLVENKGGNFNDQAVVLWINGLLVKGLDTIYY